MRRLDCSSATWKGLYECNEQVTLLVPGTGGRRCRSGTQQLAMEGLSGTSTSSIACPV